MSVILMTMVIYTFRPINSSFKTTKKERNYINTFGKKRLLTTDLTEAQNMVTLFVIINQ